MAYVVFRALVAAPIVLSMVNEERLEGLKELLKDAARAHHEATGGVNAAWAQWYAKYLAGRIGEHLGYDPGAETLATWLSTADVVYRAAERNVGWPRFYAGYILDQAEEG